MRRAVLTAGTMPGMRAVEGCSGFASEPFGTGEQQVVLYSRSGDHGHADFLRDLVTHLRQARARDEERDFHLRRLDHHLRGEPSRGVEELVAALDAIEPHHAGDGIDPVMPAAVPAAVESLSRARA